MAKTGRTTVYNNITSETTTSQINPENIELMEDFLDYLKSIDRSKETIKSYRSDLLIFFTIVLERLNNKSFIDITKREFARLQSYFINYLGWSSGRVRRVKSTISSMSNFITEILDEEEKYQYFKSAGYNFFCNVDGSQPYWVQIREHYVRQGRIDLDGYMLYKASTGQTTVLDNMFKASEVFDQRRPTPVVAHGQS